MWRELTEGYSEDAKPRMTTFPAEHEEMVTKTDILFYSLCEHHLLPFHGKVHIAYMPQGEIVGLSKLIRYTRWVSRRLNTQEGFTQDLLDGIAGELETTGVMVVTEAEHLCKAMRGIETPGTTTVTTAAQGEFTDPDGHQRQRFLQIIEQGDA
jgi:GTP cyclohydrolase I